MNRPGSRILSRGHTLEHTHSISGAIHWKKGNHQISSPESSSRRAVARILVRRGVENQLAPPHQLRGLGSAESSPSGVRGRAPAAQAVSCILQTPDGFSQHHNSANIECVSTDISLGVLFHTAKNFLLNTWGVEPVTPRLKYDPVVAA